MENYQAFGIIIPIFVLLIVVGTQILLLAKRKKILWGRKIWGEDIQNSEAMLYKNVWSHKKNDYYQGNSLDSWNDEPWMTSKINLRNSHYKVLILLCSLIKEMSFWIMVFLLLIIVHTNEFANWQCIYLTYPITSLLWFIFKIMKNKNRTKFSIFMDLFMSFSSALAILLVSIIFGYTNLFAEKDKYIYKSKFTFFKRKGKKTIKYVDVIGTIVEKGEKNLKSDPLIVVDVNDTEYNLFSNPVNGKLNPIFLLFKLISITFSVFTLPFRMIGRLVVSIFTKSIGVWTKNELLIDVILWGDGLWPFSLPYSIFKSQYRKSNPDMKDDDGQYGKQRADGYLNIFEFNCTSLDIIIRNFKTWSILFY